MFNIAFLDLPKFSKSKYSGLTKILQCELLKYSNLISKLNK